MEIKENISKNLTELRKFHGITQQELAEKLNYTSKAISKWEHGEALPDIEILSQLCSIYNITLNEIIQRDIVEQIKKQNNEEEEIKVKNIINEIVITCLSLTPVWFIATIIFVFLNMIKSVSFYPIFIISAPISFIILIIFNGIWGKRIFTYVLVSLLVWSLIVATYCTLIYINPIYISSWALFFLGIPLQVAIVLTSQLKRRK